MLLCPYCGKTLRRHQVYKKKIQWWCSTYLEKGKKACQGVKVDDGALPGKQFTEQTVVEEVVENGKKHYRYTGKTEFEHRGEGGTECTEASNGGVLPGVNRPRRAIIKL